MFVLYSHCGQSATAVVIDSSGSSWPSRGTANAMGVFFIPDGKDDRLRVVVALRRFGHSAARRS